MRKQVLTNCKIDVANPLAEGVYKVIYGPDAGREYRIVHKKGKVDRIYWLDAPNEDFVCEGNEIKRVKK